MSRKIVADCRNGAIVRTRDVCRAGRRSGYRIVDFWNGGREYVRDTAVVDVA